MIDYQKGVYYIEDSLTVPQFGQAPTIVELKVEAEQADEVMAKKAEAHEDAKEREMLLRKLGSRPTATPKAISADEFASMLDELKYAPTAQAKVDALYKWSGSFSDGVQGILPELAEAVLNDDYNAARRLVARICA